MATDAEQARAAQEMSVRKLLLYLGSAMIGGGQPVYEVEEEVRRVGWSLGYPNVQCSATPTGVHVSLASGEPAALEMSPAPMGLGQSSRLNEIRRAILAGELGITPAIAELSALRAQPPRYGMWANVAGSMMTAAALTLVLQPGWANVVLAAGLAVVVAGIRRFTSWHPNVRSLTPTIAAFVVALVAFLAAGANLIDGPLRTMVGPLVVFLPGGTMATGMAELAAGAMIAGTSRFFYGVVQLLMLGLGFAGAGLILHPPATFTMNVRTGTDFGFWAVPVALILLASGLALLESLPWRLWPWIVGLLVVTYWAQLVGQAISGEGFVGAFLASAVAIFGAGAVNAFRSEVPRLPLFTPAFWLLVPGALGLIGVTRLASSHEASISLIQTVTLTVAIALGLLVGSAVARPLYRIARRARRTAPQPS